MRRAKASNGGIVYLQGAVSLDDGYACIFKEVYQEIDTKILFCFALDDRSNIIGCFVLRDEHGDYIDNEHIPIDHDERLYSMFEQQAYQEYDY